MHLLTTLILVHVAVHSSHGGRSVIFDWSSNVTTRQTLQLHLGDELILRCTENFVSDIVQQTRAQVDACDSSIDNPNAKIPVSVNTCFGMVDTLSIPLETSSGMLPDAIVFQTGEYYYYTSYSVLNATQKVGGGLFDETSGGQCSAGLQLELQILDDSGGGGGGAGAGAGAGGGESTGGLSDALEQFEIIIIAVVCSVIVGVLIFSLILVCCCCCYRSKKTTNISGDIETTDTKGIIANQNGNCVELKKTDLPNQQNNKLKNNADKKSNKPKRIINGTQEKDVKNSNGKQSDLSKPSSTSKQVTGTERRPSANKYSGLPGGRRRTAPQQPPPKTGVKVRSSTNSSKPSGQTNRPAPSKPSNGHTKKQPGSLSNANGQGASAKTNSAPLLSRKGRKDCAVTSSVPASITQNK